jgi:hypothetical protein
MLMDLLIVLLVIALTLIGLWFIGSYIVFIALSQLVARIREHIKD